MDCSQMQDAGQKLVLISIAGDNIKHSLQKAE